MSNHPDPRSFDRPGEDAAAVAPETPETQAPETQAPESQAPEPLTLGDEYRHDGWTPARQGAFLRELAASHSVTLAARMVGMSRQSAYKLRARLKGEPFDKAWDAAFQTRFDVLAEAALNRALNGVEVQHFYNGELVGTSRKYDERLTLALLDRRRSFARPEPHMYDPASAFAADELAALADRVEHGPTEWLESPEAEEDLRYGPEALAEAAVDTEGGPLPADADDQDCGD